MRTALALTFVSGLVISLVLRVQFVGMVEANPTVGGYWENSNTVAVPLEIAILSPKNTTYSTNDLNLTIQITKTETLEPMEVGHFYVSFILDIGPYSPPSLFGEDVVNNDCTPEIYYNTVLHNLTDGQHNILVEVECFPENVSAYWWRTKTSAEAYFSVDTGSGTPAPTLTPTPTPSPEPIPVGEYPEGPRLLWNRTISEWNETAGSYAHCSASKIIQTSDGGYVVVGGSFAASSEDWGSYDWWLAKTDSNANVEWEKTFGGPYMDLTNSVVQTEDGGYAVAGTMNSQTSMQAAVVKTDSTGNIQWSQTYSDSSSASIIQTDDGGYAIAGNDYGPVGHVHIIGPWGPKPNIRLVKTDALGNEEWNNTYGVGTATSVIQTSDGGYAMMSSSSSIVLVKTDSFGEIEWKKTYGSDDDYGLSVVQAKDGGFVLFGMLTVTRRCPGLIKTDPKGNVLWEKNYLRDRAIPDDMVSTRDGGYIFWATEDWTIEEGDVYGEIVKVDSEGNISWVISFVDEAAGSVIQTFDGGYALVQTRTLMNYDSWEEYYSAVWIIKTEKDPSDLTPAVSPTLTPSPEPTTIPDSPEPTPTSNSPESTLIVESFPTTLFITSASASVAVAVGLLIYIKKRKRKYSQIVNH